jgi:hypothetical protein
LTREERSALSAAQDRSPRLADMRAGGVGGLLLLVVVVFLVVLLI